MSGPYCETCKHFYGQLIFSDSNDTGECNDPSKTITDRSGNRTNHVPIVHKKYTCMNHESEEEAG